MSKVGKAMVPMIVAAVLSGLAGYVVVLTVVVEGLGVVLTDWRPIVAGAGAQMAATAFSYIAVVKARG